ncbi:efflux RND transporter periplasmic adaptor subunit [Ruegeria sp. Ofav3-42]|uniref:efflux RND transporter periplasmic adaptor subunit n=1 Tax=Ruegeria sp. Ofav3-42 TaxID=2917759 RepID=UPI001EF707BA|nr:efflux RND transporter periplasmic adaptor subunit [Ruegeria sp. Ofav3-42]MCG7519885.1 efflux RND transporter periplasmic adaptor subunit [Ruegeria sp. Ofav3-42]
MILLVCLLLPLLVGIAYFSWTSMAERYVALEPAPPAPTQVRWAEVREQELRDWIYGEGTARAVRRSHLTFEVPGRVAEVGDDVREGASVTGPIEDQKGQLIARLDDADYIEALRIADTGLTQAERNVDMANAQLKQSKSTENLWRTRLDRARVLLDKKVVSQQKFDEATAELEVAIANVSASEARVVASEAGVLAARNEVSQARRNLERTRIHAPWDGVVARLNIREGEYVLPEEMSSLDDTSMAATFPVTLLDASTFEIEVEIPMHRRAELRVGNPAVVLRDGLAGHGVGQGKADLLHASVHAVAPMLSPDSRTVRVTLRTNEADLGLIDGELTRVKILRAAKATPVVPVEALLHRDNEAYVLVVDADTNTVSERVIQPGIREDTLVEVPEGLEPGDIVVTEGRHRLLPGDSVQLLDPEARNG